MANRVRRVRLWRWRRNQLRRRSDLLEGWLRLVAGLLLAFAIPVLSVLSAAGVARETLQEGAELRRAPAVLTEAAPGAPEPADATQFGGGGNEEGVPVNARWVAPDGTPRTGPAKAPPGSPEGTRITVWLDDAGRSRPEPVGPGEAWAGGMLCGVAAAMPTALAVLGGQRVLCGWLDARREERWAQEWAEVGPVWSGRLPGR